MIETYGVCVISGCDNTATTLHENLGVCSEHADVLSDGYAIEIHEGQYILVDLEDIDYPNLSAFARAAQGDPDLAVALYQASVMQKEAEDMHKRVDQLRDALEALLKVLEPSSKWATQAELLEYIEKKHGGDVLQAYWDAAGVLAQINLEG
jgi:hypothetical protein